MRGRSGILALAAVAVLLLALPGKSASDRERSGASETSAAAASRVAPPGFGAFAGYLWPGRVTSVRGSWVVPRIRAGSRLGWAATWIGAQAPGLAVVDTPFIQIGTIEELAACPPHSYPACRRGYSEYSAFWSDTALHNGPAPLGISIYPGDRVTVSLSLAHGKWTLSMSSLSEHTRFSTTRETDAHFDLADWIQEADQQTQQKLPYPDLTTVRFSRLDVNNRVPSSAAPLSAWMSENGQILGPSLLAGDSFRLVSQQSTAAGNRYQSSYDRLQGAFVRFTTSAATWTAKTTSESIVEQRSTFASALQTDIGSLAAGQWPSTAQTALSTLIADSRAELAQVRAAPTQSTVGIKTWIRGFLQDVQSVDDAERTVRGQLGISRY